MFRNSKNQGDYSRKGKNVLATLKECKFYGVFVQKIMETIKIFSTCFLQYLISPALKAYFFVYVFFDAARKLFVDFHGYN